MTKKCGYVAIIGCPNVGKSTLMNHILGKKISITSRKPQTTRHQVVGIKTQGDTQTIYVDTPGLHQDEPRVMNRYMNRAAATAIWDVDAIVFILDAIKLERRVATKSKQLLSDDDRWILEKLKKAECPVILALNKVDQFADKTKLLPVLQAAQGMFDFSDIVPISALKEINTQDLEDTISRYLPEGEHFFGDDQITDKPEKFVLGEFVREQIIRGCGEELPYSTEVIIEKVEQKDKVKHIHALIWVERPGQKAIIIGHKGERMKAIGIAARETLENYFDCQVNLKLWVKVKSDWSNSEEALNTLGYRDE